MSAPIPEPGNADQGVLTPTPPDDPAPDPPPPPDVPPPEEPA